MGITKTIVQGSTMAQRAAEILAYLQDKASSFFDSITADNDGNISCVVSGVTALYLPYESSEKLRIEIANGDSFEDYYSGEVKFTTLYDSTNAVMLKTNKWTIAISKNNNNHTVIAATIQSGSSDSTIGYRFADIVDGIEITTTFGEASDYKETISKESPMTAFLPVVFDSGFYSEWLLTTPYSEYVGTSGILTSGGTQYGYDGAIAIKG